MKRKTEGDADKGWRLRERWIYGEIRDIERKVSRCTEGEERDLEKGGEIQRERREI